MNLHCLLTLCFLLSDCKRDSRLPFESIGSLKNKIQVDSLLLGPHQREVKCQIWHLAPNMVLPGLSPEAASSPSGVWENISPPPLSSSPWSKREGRNQLLWQAEVEVIWVRWACRLALPGSLSNKAAPSLTGHAQACPHDRPEREAQIQTSGSSSLRCGWCRRVTWGHWRGWWMPGDNWLQQLRHQPYRLTLQTSSGHSCGKVGQEVFFLSFWWYDWWYDSTALLGCAWPLVDQTDLSAGWWVGRSL